MIGAVELSIAMPISWLPLIGDYSSAANDRLCAVGMPSLGYFAGSVLMYLFGLFIGVATGGDIFAFIAQNPFRYLACGVAALSTLTTAFLDLYSAAESARSIVRTGERAPILVIGVFAAIVSVLFPAERYGAFLSGFLTTISMVFVPVYTVIFLDFIRGKRACQKAFHAPKLLLAAAGMAAYNVLTRYEIGSPTLLCVLLVALLYGIGLAAGKRRRI
jgi:purine-cytosine permease-like protein